MRIYALQFAVNPVTFHMNGQETLSIFTCSDVAHSYWNATPQQNGIIIPIHKKEQDGMKDGMQYSHSEPGY